MSSHSTSPPVKHSLPIMTAPTNLQSSSPFKNVPLEVLLRISAFLTTPDLGSFRLTCRSIEKSLLGTFTREFFTKRQFMLTEYSLQALIDISQSRMSDCLVHVIVGLDCFPNKFFQPDDHALESRYRIISADHHTLITSGQAIFMLTEAFRNLRYLETVGIRDYHSSERRWRDGPSANWASYGATTIGMQTGVNLLRCSSAEEIQAYAIKVMTILFTSLGDAGARPKAFEWLRRRRGAPSDDCFNLFTKYLEPKVAPVLEGLQALLLDVNVEMGPWRITHAPGKPGEDDGRRYDYLLRLFLGHLPNLRHLRLNFFPGTNSKPIDRFMSWLARPVYEPPQVASSPPAPPAPPADSVDLPLLAPPPPVDFRDLRGLDLGAGEIDPKRIIHVVRKFALTLKKLELWKVTLCNRRATQAGQADLFGHNNKVNLWAQTLKALCEVPGLELYHIKVGFPNQRSHGIRRRVRFEQKDDPPAPPGDLHHQIQEYTGIDWRHFVKDLASRVKVEAPPPEMDSDDEEEDPVDIEDESIEEPEMADFIDEEDGDGLNGNGNDNDNDDDDGDDGDDDGGGDDDDDDDGA